MSINVNYLAVLVAAIVSMAIGFLWYSPMVLGKPWMKERGLSQDDLKKAQKSMGALYGLSFVLALITAYVLTHVMVFSENFFHYSWVATGISSAFWMWVGFIMPVQATATIFGNKHSFSANKQSFSSNRNWKLLGIDTGYQLASILSMGVVIGLLK